MKLARGLAIWVLVFSLLVSNTIITFADSNAGGQNQTTATGKGSVLTSLILNHFYLYNCLLIY